ncbi:Retinoic acid induced 16-like protein-domain-containing protein [Phlyctochytrium arcticum]|nr:Retinoic acid induced 16-like protein-domain-containing protein [Phlyctochytrium arcticum]
MDFFTKLRDHVQRTVRGTDNLLGKFEDCWEAIVTDLQEWDLARESGARHVRDTRIPMALQEMEDILLREQSMVDSRQASSSPCAELFLNTDMLGQLVQLSGTDTPPGFRSEVIQSLSSLISLLEGESLFHASLHGAVDAVIRRAVASDDGCDDVVLELEANVAIKIQELPTLAALFFRKHHVPANVDQKGPREGSSADLASSSPASSSSVGGLVGQSVDSTTNQAAYTFPLFDHLSRFVHLDGKQGDMARASCLLILQIDHPDLQHYIASSDFAMVIVSAGLGGMFSSLPHRLPEGILLRSGGNTQGRTVNYPQASDYATLTFSRDLDALSTHLRFIQAVLARSPNPLATQILTEFRRAFLRQVVQPQFEAASDFDGSCVAMLFYIGRLVSECTEQRLGESMVQWLLSEEEDDDEKDDTDRPVSSKDITLHVRDILLSKINSLSEHVVIATLQLFSLLLSLYPTLTLNLLFPSLAHAAGLELTDVLDVQQQMDGVQRFLEFLDQDQGQDGVTQQQGQQQETSLEAYLEDAEELVRTARSVTQTWEASRPSSSHRLKHPFRLDTSLSNSMSSLTLSSPSSPLHSNPTQPLPTSQIQSHLANLSRAPALQKLMAKLSTFLNQTMEINVALTGVVSALIACGNPLLNLLLVHGDLIDHVPDLDADTDEGDSAKPSFTSLYTLLSSLHAEIATYRSSHPNFDTQLSHLRSSLLSGTLHRTRDWDVETEYIKNVVVLQEFGKEIVGLVIKSGEGVDVWAGI